LPIGSIFNNVIYVSSFLWTDPEEKDVTMMTEKFICKLLLPKWKEDSEIIKNLNNQGYHDGDLYDDYYTLKTYNKILEWELAKEKVDEDLRKRAIMMLYQFAFYLSHISNGAPKKLSNYFEKYIITIEKSKNKNKKNEVEESKNKLPNIIKDEPEIQFYLKFNYREQRKIGFIHYLAFPVISAILNNASRYGDKLLISGCFLTNHIYKYHNSGFSWRNLENIPELLDINKSPETREFIEVIISFLKRSRLSTTINGLYQFKFPMRIAEEISIMSRLSEEVSALLNFTLDDSLSLKRHYTKLLEYYVALQNNTLKNVGGVVLSASQNDFHHAIIGIRQILGDLHALDEEYNEAIFEYQCCIDILLKDKDKDRDKNNNDSHYSTHILNTTRIMLKLGLMFEKRKTHNTAYLIYNEIIAYLVEFGYINKRELGLSYKQRIRNIKEIKDAWKGRRDDVVYKPNEWYYDNSNFEDKVQPEIEYKEGEKWKKWNKLHYEVKGEELIPQLHQQLSPEKNTLAIRLSVFEDIALVYQALLARLFVLEKQGLSGITKENIDILESDFLYLQRAVYYRGKYMIAADFFRKLADILYYKNGLIDLNSSDTLYMALYLWDGFPIDSFIYEFFLKNSNHDEIWEKFLNLEAKVGLSLILPKGKTNNQEDQIDEFSELFSELSNCLGELYPNESKKKIESIRNCTHRRRALLSGYESNIRGKKIYVKNKRTPCYACKYYTRSLRIMRYNMMQSNELMLSDRELLKKEVKLLKRLSKRLRLLKELEVQPKEQLLKWLGELLNEKLSKKLRGLSKERLLELLKEYSLKLSEELKKLINKQEEESKELRLKKKRVPSQELEELSRKLRELLKKLDELFEEQEPLEKLKELLKNLEELQLSVVTTLNEDISKAIFFISRLTTKEGFKTQKESDILTLASALDGMGNTLLSCSMANSEKKRENDRIKEKFMEGFIKLIRRNKDHEVDKFSIIAWPEKEDFSFMERSLLYFWAAASYFKYSANMKDAFFCYKKILHVFEAYLEVHEEGAELIKESLGYIRKHLIGNAIQNLYMQYENTNKVEISKLKWLFSKDSLDEKLPLNLLSLFPDLEEIIISYCRLELLCGKYDMVSKMYNSMPLSKYRIESTITERIVSLRFKADINMKILNQLLQLGENNTIIYKPDFSLQIYQNYYHYLERPLAETIGDCSVFFHPSYVPLKEDGERFKNLESKIELISFLMRDTMFSLSKIIEIISPNTTTTLFSESYMGDVYMQLFECNHIFDYIYEMFKSCEPNGNTTSLIKSIRNRLKNNEKINDKNKEDIVSQTEVYLTKIKDTEEIKRIVQENYSKYFLDSTKKYLDKSDLHNNQTSYLQEMALRKYKRAIEMHHESGAYQELIANMYYLEDNLSNNTFQFHFAIERYYNNCGILNERVKTLKSVCDASSLLDMESYIGEL